MTGLARHLDADLADLDTLNEPELIAVYGTLRTGQGNDRIWKGRAVSRGLDHVDGYTLWTTGAFPYAVPGPPDMRITVELIEPERHHRARVMADMDRLEGYPSHYTRIVVIATEGDAAWMYVPPPDRIRGMAEHFGRSLQLVKSGDWANRHPRG